MHQQLLQHLVTQNPSAISDTFLPHSQYLTSNITHLQPNKSGVQEYGNKILPSSPSSRSTSPHPE